MNTKLGYSIRYGEKSMVAMGVSSLEHGRWRIENLEQNQTSAGPSSSLIKNMVNNPEGTIMLTSGSDARTALITLPKLKKKEMALAAAGWVAREESSAPDEYCVSWRERKGENKSENKDTKDVFLLYAPRADVDQHLAQVKVWGAKPQRMLPDFMILDGMFRQFHPQAQKLAAWNIVFVSKEDHFLCVSTQSSMLLTRPLQADLSDGTDAAEYYERLATEVDRSIFFARQTEFNPDIQGIVVCGDPEVAEGLIEHLKQETTISAEYWDLGSCFELESGKLEPQLLLPAMAAALALKKNPYNLLPEQPRVILGQDARRRLVLATTTAAVAMVPILLVGGLITSNVQNRYLDDAHRQLEISVVRADEAADVYKAQCVLLDKERHIAEFSENDADYAAVLLHLANLTPHQIIFQDLRLKEANDGQLVLFLSGESKADSVTEAQESFLEFQHALQASALLVAAGEPRKLLINTKHIKGVTVKKVEFSMEYQVHFEPSSPAAIASLGMENERLAHEWN